MDLETHQIIASYGSSCNISPWKWYIHVVYQNWTGQGISSVFLTSYESLVSLDPLSLSPLDMYTLELEHFTWTTLEGDTLELTHSLELYLDRILIYIYGFFSWLMRLLFLLKWGHGVLIGFLITSNFHNFWIQPLIIKFRYILLIIIFLLRG